MTTNAIDTSVLNVPPLAPVMSDTTTPAEQPLPPKAEPKAEPKFEANDAKRNAALKSALAQMKALGKANATGAASLTNAGVTATRLVHEKVVNESHVDAMYEAFAKGNNEVAKGGTEMVVADKSAISRFKTFFKPEVAAFIYASGRNVQWHDEVWAIRAGIEASNRKGSLYNAMVTFNREVIKHGKDAVNVITSEHVTALLTKDPVADKTDLERLRALLEAVNKTKKQTGLDWLGKIADAIEAQATKMGKTQTSQVSE